MIRYVTAAQAERIRQQVATMFAPAAAVGDWERQSGVLGTLKTDYYIVPDDDPRLTRQAPDPFFEP